MKRSLLLTLAFLGCLQGLRAQSGFFSFSDPGTLTEIQIREEIQEADEYLNNLQANVNIETHELTGFDLEQDGFRFANVEAIDGQPVRIITDMLEGGVNNGRDILFDAKGEVRLVRKSSWSTNWYHTSYAYIADGKVYAYMVSDGRESMDQSFNQAPLAKQLQKLESKEMDVAYDALGVHADVWKILDRAGLKPLAGNLVRLYGDIAGKYPINVALVLSSSNEVRGAYAYLRNSCYMLNLTGMQVGHVIRLDETDHKGHVTGTFELTRTGNTYTGSWFNKDKTLIVELTSYE